MSWLEHINKRIVGRIAERAGGINVEKDGLAIKRYGEVKHHLFSDITAAYLWQKDIYVGTEIILRLEFSGLFSIEIGESDGVWSALIMALDASGRLISPLQNSITALIADGASAPPLSLGLQ